MATHADERSLGEMFADLSRDTRTLFQQEFQLAKAELTETAVRLSKGAALLVGGGLLAYAGLLAIVAALVLVLIAVGLPAWAGALLGGLLVGAVSYFLIRAGLAAFRSQGLAPRQTIETLREGVQWLKSQTR